MQTTIRNIQTRASMYMANAYKYDQLNRLSQSKSFLQTGYDAGSNSWNTQTATNAYYNAFTYDANGNILTQKRHTENGAILDDLTYKYHTTDASSGSKLLRNRLYHLKDTVPQSVSNSDLDDMGIFQNSTSNPINGSNNYVYDAEGRLVFDRAEGLAIEWRVDGKIKRITDEVDNGTTPNGPQLHRFIEFDYDAMEEKASLLKTNEPNGSAVVVRRRIAKHTFKSDFGLVKSTYYALDAQGNSIAVYEHEKIGANVTFKQEERYIYGSS